MSTDCHRLVIDCDDCCQQHTNVCRECVVSFVCDTDRQPRGALVFDLAEARAVRLLTSAGMVPASRHRVHA